MRALMVWVWLIGMPGVHASDLANLKTDIEKLTEGQKATYGIAYYHLQRGETLLINAEDRMHAASTMKVPVMMRLFEMAQAGELDLDQPIPVKNSFKSIVDGSDYSITVDSDEDLYGYIGKELPIRRLMTAMIVRSSNLATNILIELADAEKVMSLMAAIGANNIYVRRGVEDLKAFEAKLNNESDAASMMKVMAALAKDKRFLEVNRDAMIEVLRGQEFTDTIPAGIPSEAGAIVANKTGAISYIQHDAAIVDLPSGRRYVLVIFARNFEDQREKVKETGRKISQRVYNHVVSQP